MSLNSCSAGRSNSLFSGSRRRGRSRSSGDRSCGSVELLDLNIGKCRLAVAGPNDYIEDRDNVLRVATKFANVAKDYYSSINREIEIIKLNGSIELAPILGLSDVIVDIVESGKTLKENNLKVLTTIVPVSARFIANRSSYLFKSEAIQKMMAGLQEVLSRDADSQS